MLGAIAGDIIGSVFEGSGRKTKEFDLFGPDRQFTDDTVLAVAVAAWILDGGDLVDHLHEWFHRYPRAGYGGTFVLWAGRRERQPYNSWGNGSAMRVAPVGFACSTLEESLAWAQRSAEVTHNHPEGIRGAQATAAAIFLARSGHEKSAIRQEIAARFGYDLSTPLAEIRDSYRFDVSCQGSTPQSIVAFLEADDFEEAVRNAVSLGGDADTMACIAGGIAEAYWGVPDAIARETLARLDEPLRAVVEAFRERFPQRPPTPRAATAAPATGRTARRQAAYDDRRRGCLIGLAVGDALGAAVEFMAPGAFPPVDDYRAGGPHRLNPGEWTDDTSLALALADSIVSVGWDLNDQARRYVAWWRHGQYSVNGRCFDIGIATRSALARFERTGDAQTSGERGESSSGNGSIMRLAPVAVALAGDFPQRLDRLLRRAAESSLPTHASRQCRDACRYFALLLAGLMHGVDRDEVLSPDWPPLAELRRGEPLHEAIDEVAAGSFRRRQPPQITGGGYVVRSLEAALWAFVHAADFRSAVLAAVNLGDDADTTGAVCGQLAGACWGESGIPDAWRGGLARRDLIDPLAVALLRVSLANDDD